jgi:hypothetical protein
MLVLQDAGGGGKGIADGKDPREIITEKEEKK